MGSLRATRYVLAEIFHGRPPTKTGDKGRKTQNIHTTDCQSREPSWSRGVDNFVGGWVRDNMFKRLNKVLQL